MQSNSALESNKRASELMICLDFQRYIDARNFETKEKKF